MTDSAVPPIEDGRDRPGRLGAVILTGGTAARMGGTDKALIELGGVTLLERALAATAAADEVVVVGDQVATSRRVGWAREQPPGGGPAAAILAGVAGFVSPPELVAVLAVDMAQATAGTVARLLVAADGDVDGAVLADVDGRQQPLCAIYRTAALESARPRDEAGAHGLPVFALLRSLRLVEVAAVGFEARDVDTWADLDDLRSLEE